MSTGGSCRPITVLRRSAAGEVAQEMTKTPPQEADLEQFPLMYRVGRK